MRPKRMNRPAFTIVELLVVIGVIALLLGLLMPALSGALSKGRKSTEISHLRQVGMAWTQYASYNKDMALPGYLEPEVQTAWNVRYRLPDGNDVVLADAAPHTWRLLPYLENSHEVIHGYLEEGDPGVLQMVAEAAEVAQTPWFGYNGYYVGGWWEDDGSGTPVMRFNADRTVARSPSQIRRTDDFVVFCTATPAETTGVMREFNDIDSGFHIVSPPYLGESTFDESHRIWAPEGDRLQILTATSASQPLGIPMNRYTNAASILYADLHTDAATLSGLNDMRKWINRATRKLPDSNGDLW